MALHIELLKNWTRYFNNT